ncbi:hypothetical protein HPB47_026606, partial [Ixodes persulcatus]
PSEALFRTFSLVICARLVISASNPLSDAPVVYTDHGPILGRKLALPARHVDAFYGIPFAEPPIGKLRFQKPVPAKSWKGIYNATEKPKPCWQYDVHYSTITLNYLNASISSEDCLFLNVWRPSSEILLGSTSNEGSYFLDFLKSQVPQLTEVLSIDYRLAATVAISTLLDAPFVTAKTIVHAYFGDDSIEHDETSLNGILEKIFGDVVVDCPTIFFGEVTAELGINVYRYIFAHRPSYSVWPESFGPTHNDDLA